jgi:hypothetical protein
MKFVVAVLAGVSLFAVSAPALAHSGTWWWTPLGANSEVQGSYLVHTDEETGDEYEEYVDYAKCYGRGTKWRKNGRIFYKHFECYVETTEDADPYWIYVHITARTKFVFTFLEYDYERG